MDKNKHYYLIGIGGIGMSGIAHLLVSCGARVSGSDLKESRVTQELARKGVKVHIGHAASNIDGANIVVYSSAVKEDNPEFKQAQKTGLPLLKRAQALSGLMDGKTVITVAGSHGKTTTTSLVSYLLLEAGLHPSVAIGGILKNIDTNACLGGGEFFVAEADESDGSFLYYKPKFSIVTNIDAEHLDYYKEFDRELDAFKQFLNNTEDEGCLFCCQDDKNLMDLLRGYGGKHILFGLKETADIYPKNIRLKGLSSEFDCFYRGEPLGRFGLSLGGMHNISNALSVIALGFELGIDLECIKKCLRDYKGAKRRLEVKFSSRDILLIDDYAHHPAEIMATLSAVSALDKNRIIAVFQPHRYSRTKFLLDEFAASFSHVDHLIITDIYAAGEEPIPGIDARLLAERIKNKGPDKKVIYLPKEQIVKSVLEITKPGDLVITLGAGDIVKLSDELAEILKKD